MRTTLVLSVLLCLSACSKDKPHQLTVLDSGIDAAQLDDGSMPRPKPDGGMSDGGVSCVVSGVHERYCGPKPNNHSSSGCLWAGLEASSCSTNSLQLYDCGSYHAEVELKSTGDFSNEVQITYYDLHDGAAVAYAAYDEGDVISVPGKHPSTCEVFSAITHFTLPSTCTRIHPRCEPTDDGGLHDDAGSDAG